MSGLRFATLLAVTAAALQGQTASEALDALPRLLEQGRYQEAGRTITGLAGYATQALEAGDPHSARKVLETLQQILDSHRGPAAFQQAVETMRPRLSYLRGFAADRLYRFEEAESRFREALKGDPNKVNWLKNLARVLLEQRRNLAALEVLDRALEQEDRTDLHFARAMCLMNAARNEEAEAELHICLEEGPNDPEVRYKLAELMVDRGAYGESVPHLRRSLELDPDNLEARYLLGLALARSGDADDAEEARGHFRSVLEEVPGHVGALFNLGRLLLAAGNKEEGRRILDRFSEMSTLEDRVAFLKDYVRNEPTHAGKRFELGKLLLRAGYTGKALEALQAARRLAPRKAGVYRYLARALRRLGRVEQAARAEAFAARLEKRDG